MLKFHLKYSLKTIPAPPKKQYMISMIEKSESLGKRMLWTLYHAKNPNNRDRKETYGFKTANSPPKDEELRPFLNDLAGMINKIKFSQKDVQRIKKCENIIVKDDKTNNLYEVKPQDYNKKIDEEIHKEYKTVNKKVLEDVNAEAAKLCKSLEIDDRVDVIAEAERFITYKDHKEDFVQKPKCRLINPAKSSVGKISKIILERANKKIREQTKANQWVCSKDVVTWFHKIQDKKNSTFIKFDIDAFYPSITADLFAKAIAFGRQYVEISDSEEEVLWNA